MRKSERRSRRKREEPLPDGYSFRQRVIQPYKNKLDSRYQTDFMIAVHKFEFQNDWDLINPSGEIVIRCHGSERSRAIRLLKLQIRGGNQ